MVGIGFDLNHIDNDILDKIDILNIENPLYPNYLDSEIQADIQKIITADYKKAIITDGAYIDINPGTSEKAVRELTKQKVIRSIQFAEQIRSQEIIFLSTFLPMIKLSSYEDAFVQNSISFWKEVLKNTDIHISLCNTFEYNPDILIRIAEGVNNKNFGLAFDIGHAFVFGHEPLKDFFEKLEPYCNTVYLHSNNGDIDSHLNLFEGTLINSIEFQKIVLMIKNKNILLKPFDKSNLNKNLQVLNDILSKN